jgi:gamma-glutamylcyclotransferase (GGCT)/AIG2-like uncharacterized protein YtfP
MEGAQFIGEVELDAHFLVLYEGGYPALVAGSTDTSVAGELYQVTASHLSRLDEFEECPELYFRGLVRCATGETAWAYLISQKEASRFPRIAGKWEARDARHCGA